MSGRRVILAVVVALTLVLTFVLSQSLERNERPGKSLVLSAPSGNTAPWLVWNR